MRANGLVDCKTGWWQGLRRPGRATWPPPQTDDSAPPVWPASPAPASAPSPPALASPSLPPRAASLASLASKRLQCRAASPSAPYGTISRVCAGVGGGRGRPGRHPSPDRPEDTGLKNRPSQQATIQAYFPTISHPIRFYVTPVPRLFCSIFLPPFRTHDFDAHGRQRIGSPLCARRRTLPRCPDRSGYARPGVGAPGLALPRPRVRLDIARSAGFAPAPPTAPVLLSPLGGGTSRAEPARPSPSSARRAPDVALRSSPPTIRDSRRVPQGVTPLTPPHRVSVAAGDSAILQRRAIPRPPASCRKRDA